MLAASVRCFNVYILIVLLTPLSNGYTVLTVLLTRTCSPVILLCVMYEVDFKPVGLFWSLGTVKQSV